jgi:putative PIN family toxin of toxin-antitoxin system
MSQNATPARLVLDTNVWLDWLVFADAGVTPIKDAVANGTVTIFISAACEVELTRVLGYALSGRTLDALARVAALAQCRTIAQTAEDCVTPHLIETLPRCEDPDDQMFLELARDCRADVLITKDRDLLTLATRKMQTLPFRILTPREFARIGYTHISASASQ